MKISGEQILSAAQQRVWDLFNDPDRLSRLIPGCEKLEIREPDHYAGTINIGIAAVKGIYTGTIRLEDKKPPEHYKMVIDAKGRQGFIRGSGTIDLSAKDFKATMVKYSGDVQLGGPLIQVGQRLVDGAAKMMMAQFFAAADAELKADASGAIARQGIFINLWRSLVRLIRSFFGSR